MITDYDSRYYLVVWRRPKFFLFNYIQPAVLINIIALFVFLIPAESGEKVTLGISTMLNMTVFLMTVTSGIPPTDNTPILSEIWAPLLTSYLHWPLCPRYLLRHGDGADHGGHVSRGDRAQDPPPGPARHPRPALSPQARPVDGGHDLLKISSSREAALKSY